MARDGRLQGALSRARRAAAGSGLLIATAATVLAVFVVAAWSAAAERRATLADFSQEHSSLAMLVGADVEHRLEELAAARAGRAGPPTHREVVDLLVGARRLEERGEQLVLVSRPHQEGFLTTDGKLVSSRPLRRALEEGRRTMTMEPDEAAVFGLPRRVALGGLARVTRPDGPWGVVVLGSAMRIRNREAHERWRLAITVVVTTVIVGGFGVVARQRERRRLALEREVAVSRLERDRETLLARADKMASVAALSTGIAHELGTPLGVIVGRVEQALDRVQGDERAARSLRIVLEQVARIQVIVRGCLALARGQSPELVHAAPAALADAALSLARHRFVTAGVELVSTIEPDLPEMPCAPALIEQAIVNLLLNACEASPRGSTVHLRVERRGAGVAFTVDDEGVGIADDVARSASEPFFSTRKTQGGSGLGLTIAQEIVAHHAGSLTVGRRPGDRGTRATVEIGTRRAAGRENDERV